MIRIGGCWKQLDTSTYYDTENIAYDRSFTKTVLKNTTHGVYMGTSSIGDYAIFAGGRNSYYESGTSKSDVIALNGSLTEIYAESLSYNKARISGIETPEYALFIGGTDNHKVTVGGDGNYWSNYDTIEMYDKYLTKTIMNGRISEARGSICSAYAGANTIICAGGERFISGSSSINSNVVDVISI